MASKKRNTQKKHIRFEGTYSCRGILHPTSGHPGFEGTVPLPSEAYLHADFREKPFPKFHDCIQGEAGLRVLRSLWKICICHHGISDRDRSGPGQR